jgi:hypothetical protein
MMTREGEKIVRLINPLWIMITLLLIALLLFTLFPLASIILFFYLAVLISTGAIGHPIRIVSQLCIQSGGSPRSPPLYR